MGELEDYIIAVKSLLSTGTARYGDRMLTLPWWNDRFPIPVLMSAHGPKGLEIAGRIADGVIVGTGLTADAVEIALSHISRGAKSSGRSLADLRVWFLAFTGVDDDDERSKVWLRFLRSPGTC